MPRELPLGNGSLQINFDGAYRIIDLYYPYVGGAADKAANLGGESPLPSVARFGRLAYPTWTKVTTSTVLGRRSHGCHTTVCRIGGSDRGGKQIWRPEANDCSPEIGYLS